MAENHCNHSKIVNISNFKTLLMPKMGNNWVLKGPKSELSE